MKYGFTLVELIVSVSITAILMVGLSTFFSSSFRHLFDSREKTSNLHSQFLTSLVLQEKLSAAEQIQEIGAGGVVLKNDFENGLPFTYLAYHENKIVFKDFFIFNGMEAHISSFNDVNNVKNPGGITKMGDQFFVVSPLEDAVYQCASLPGSCETKLSVEGLNYPIDITNDGVNLYLTDAGNNRVVKISNVGLSNDVTQLAEGFHFPTGIEYYNKDDGYLFVSDTYHHQVKKINLADNTISVIVGKDAYDHCDQTAEFCQLELPTGLVIGDDGNGEALYITDSASGLVLKITDPQPDLSNVQFPLTLNDSTEIQSIDFILNEDATINSVQEGLGGNTLHKGLYNFKDQTLTYQLNAISISNVFMEECQGDPPNCKNYFQGFLVNEANNIFEEGDQLFLAGKAFDVLYVNPAPGGFLVGVMPDDTLTNPPAPDSIQIQNVFSGAHTFHLDLTGIDFMPGFNSIIVQAHNLKDQIINELTDRRVIRIGDGRLGTPEDQIEVVNKGFAYPTGLGWKEGQLVLSEQADYSTDFQNFDYETDFEVNNFSLGAKNDDSILEIHFEALLAIDANGEEKYEAYTLNTALKNEEK